MLDPTLKHIGNVLKLDCSECSILDYFISLILVHSRFDHLCFSVLRLLCLCACLFICTLWSPAGKGLTSLLPFVVSNCEFVTFPLVFWVRCGT